MVPGPSGVDGERVRQEIQNIFNAVLAEEKLLVGRAERDELFDLITAEILGYGPIEPFLHDAEVTEVMVNGPKMVYVERRGRLERTTAEFVDDDHVMRIIQRIVTPLGRRIDSQLAHGRCPPGRRLARQCDDPAAGPERTHAYHPQLRPRPACKSSNCIRFGSFCPEIVALLQAAIAGHQHHDLRWHRLRQDHAFECPLRPSFRADERFVTVEDAAELQLRQKHVVRLETRTQNTEGRGEVTIRNLIVNCFRMRPDRIVVGEVRSGEALDMLQAMNTGHDGSLTTLHSNGPRDTLRRLETMVLMAGMDLPLRAIREQIASAVESDHPSRANARRLPPRHLCNGSSGHGGGHRRPAGYLYVRPDRIRGRQDRRVA